MIIHFKVNPNKIVAILLIVFYNISVKINKLFTIDKYAKHCIKRKQILGGLDYGKELV